MIIYVSFCFSAGGVEREGGVGRGGGRDWALFVLWRARLGDRYRGRLADGLTILYKIVGWWIRWLDGGLPGWRMDCLVSYLIGGLVFALLALFSAWYRDHDCRSNTDQGGSQPGNIYGTSQCPLGVKQRRSTAGCETHALRLQSFERRESASVFFFPLHGGRRTVLRVHLGGVFGF